MKAIPLTFLGNFEDAFLYRGKLFILTEEQSIRVYNIEEIINDLEKNKSLLAASLLFGRNDLLTEESITKHLKNDVDIFINSSVYIEQDNYSFVEWNLNLPDDILLELNIYNGRIYIGTNKGLYHLDLNWEKEGVCQVGDLQKRLDARCIHTSAKFGTINASCASEGLFCFLNDFALIDDVKKQEHFMEASLRTNWQHFNFINYSTVTSPTLYISNKVELLDEESRLAVNLEDEQWLIVNIEGSAYKLSNLLNAHSNLENIQFIYNSNKSLFVLTGTGNLHTIKLPDVKNTSSKFSFNTRVYKSPITSVSSIHTIRAGCGPGMILEESEKVFLFAKKEFISTFDSELISIRTFPRSKHYQNILSLTNSEATVLLAIFDDNL